MFYQLCVHVCVCVCGVCGVHRVIIEDPENINKLADAIYPEKQIAFLKGRNNI